MVYGPLALGPQNVKDSRIAMNRIGSFRKLANSLLLQVFKHRLGNH